MRDPSAETLDEFLSQLANRPGGVHGSKSDRFLELLGVDDDSAAARDAQPAGVVWQYVARALRSTGAELGELAPGDQLGSWVARWYRADDSAASRAEPLPSYSLVLRSPNDRLAMLPSARPDTGEADEAFDSPWCTPVTLVNRLKLLAGEPCSADWAREALDEVGALTSNDRPSPAAAAHHLALLQALSQEAIRLASSAEDTRLCAELLRAHWGIDRRLQCWSLMRNIAVAAAAKNRFATRVPWNSTANAYAGQGSDAPDLHSLSSDLETYEQNRSPRLARSILKHQVRLAQSPDARQQELARQIEENYRNSNVRVAISAKLIQRFVPKQQNEMRPVRDRIVGTPVRGQSITNSENNVVLHPDTERWHVDLQSTGTVDSDTVADGGQVRVHTVGSTSFTAEKSIVVERGGVRMGQSTADASSSSHLLGVRTDFDWMPLVNDMVRTRAIDEYRRKRPLAQAEVEWKVAGRVERQLDEHAGGAVDRMQRQLREQVTGPLESAGVELTPIELTTTDRRVIARLRVAGRDQLGGHTPRPRAPSDSLASVQVHESALTNAAVSLTLDGKRLTAPELQQLVREKFARNKLPAETVVEADTVFEFAPRCRAIPPGG